MSTQSRSQPAPRAIRAFQAQFCFQLPHGRPSVPQQVVPSAVSVTARSLQTMCRLRRALGSLLRGPVEIKCTIAAALLSLYVCPAESRGKRGAEVWVPVQAQKMAFYDVGLSCFGAAFKPQNPSTDTPSVM